MKTLRTQRGQFMPISAMVMFTTVMFLTAVFNVYKVARAKLKVQNLADAVALNVASQMASSMNKVADLNEWMNHITAAAPNTTPTKPGDLPNCANVNPDMPPISCAENATGSDNLNKFSEKGNAGQYAAMIQTVNQSQQLFINAYNNFIGAGTASTSGNSSLQSILAGDIPELMDPGTSVYVWNYQGGRVSGPAVQGTSAAGGPMTSTLNTSGMQALKFNVHPISVTYKTTMPILNTPGPSYTKTLGELLNSGNGPSPVVGYMEPDSTSPQINITSGGGKQRIGVGARVSRVIQVPILGSLTVSAQAQAYVVKGSGQTGDLVLDPSTGQQRPVFKPTYWVKLSGA